MTIAGNVERVKAPDLFAPELRRERELRPKGDSDLPDFLTAKYTKYAKANREPDDA